VVKASNKAASATEHANEWITWAVRGVLVLLGSLILWQVRSVQQMHEDVAVIRNTVESHGKQIQAIWERFRKQ